MRRKRFFILVAVLLCVGIGLMILPHFLAAQPGQPDPAPKVAPAAAVASIPKPNTALPVNKVILFTSGVGFFQREGQVEGDTRFDLSFPVQDINDLLKSMVLRDLGGGKISTVSYDSHDPIDKTLKSFAINLSGNPGFADILNQARGEKVAVTWQPPGHVNPLITNGTIVGVEKKKQPVAKDAVADVEFVNVWGQKGMTSIKVPEVIQVQFENPALASELNRALEVVSQSHDTQKKTVSLFFTGKGKRTVQVGYVVEHPIWKTSYRMVLSKGAKPFLQGWAMVENPTSEDWNDVNLSLVSGRPVSFKMDLYQPLYVDRPLVQLELFSNLKPVRYEGEMEEAKKFDGKKQALKESFMADKAAAGGFAPAPAAPGAGFMPGKDFMSGMQQTTPAAAQGVKLGDQFQYVINQPVSVARQKSALVPIVNVDIEGSKVSIFNEKSLAKYPMLGLKFKNTTPLHLMQGPITVFAEDSYAGDALINDIQPNEERLLSYAVDLAAEVKTEAKQAADPKIKMSITKGIVHKTIILRDTKTYTVKNRADQEKLVVLEHPIRSPEFVLVTPTKAPAQTQSYYRFELPVPPDTSKSLDVVEEKKVFEEIFLTNANDQTIAFLIKSPSATPAFKDALQKAIELKLKWAKTEAEINTLKGKLQVISEDQARQRDNMKVIPQTDPVYKKYLEKFLKQEEQIDALRGQIEQLQATAVQQRQAYEDLVLNLSVKEE